LQWLFFLDANFVFVKTADSTDVVLCNSPKPDQLIDVPENATDPNCSYSHINKACHAMDVTGNSGKCHTLVFNI